ncbi:hypothetical protein [Nocardia farcinica]|uniref:Uncharacterized protein n=1 Tax=Nocardia farcinica (strain IFM 10152) TaxID=247156 RepID=Q5YSJ7_NOCFA|nr:hypothetical protein [Nocardia farcinica]BAD58844.1 hypothetical protein NFA_39960 [Nocardia farcinica IFM 10152]
MAERVTDEQLDDWIANASHPQPDEQRAMAHELVQLRQLVRDLTDPDECWFDHHGGCQAHGYLSLEPGELCPHAEAKQLIADWDQAGPGEARR